LYPSPYAIRMCESKHLGSVRHVTRNKETRKASTYLLREKEHLGYINVDWSIILKWISEISIMSVRSV